MALRTYIAVMAAIVVATLYGASRTGTCAVESLVNVVLYGFLSLLAVIVLQRERHFRGIFYQVCLLFTGFNLIIALRVFSSLSGRPGLQSDVYVYATMVLPLLVCWTVVYILYAYLFSGWARPRRLLLTLLTVLPVWLLAFYPYYLDPHALALGPGASNPQLYYRPLFERGVFVDLLSLSALTTFFIFKLRSDRPFGVYIDTLMVWFSLFVSFQILYGFTRVSSFAIFTISQYAATVTLLMMAVTFALRLRFLSQTAGVLYESQIVSDKPFVGRRSGMFDRFIRGNFFNSKAIKKRLFLETPRGRVTHRFPRGTDPGAASSKEKPTGGKES
jgi:hypothetical protein